MNVAEVELVRIMSFKIYIITIIIKYDSILKILSTVEQSYQIHPFLNHIFLKIKNYLLKNNS